MEAPPALVPLQSTPEVGQFWASESLAKALALELAAAAAMSPDAAEGGSCSGSRGMSGKNGLVPARAELDSASATGMLLGSACESRLDIRLAGGSEAVGLTDRPPAAAERAAETAALEVGGISECPPAPTPTPCCC